MNRLLSQWVVLCLGGPKQSLRFPLLFIGIGDCQRLFLFLLILMLRSLILLWLFVVLCYVFCEHVVECVLDERMLMTCMMDPLLSRRPSRHVGNAEYLWRSLIFRSWTLLVCLVLLRLYLNVFRKIVIICVVDSFL